MRSGAPRFRHRRTWTSQLHRRPHEVALAQLHPAVAQDVVGGGAVEIEVGQRLVDEEALAGEFARGPARKGDLDLLALAAVDLSRLEAFEKVDRLGDALLELGDRRF